MTVSENDFVDIYTICKSYELVFVMTGSGLTDADVQMLVDFISDMDLLTVEQTAFAVPSFPQKPGPLLYAAGPEAF